MKKLVLFSIAALVMVFGSVKLYADIASLPQTVVPAAADIVTIFDASTGKTTGVNWSFFSRNMLQGVNWVGLNTTTGAINWNYVGQ